MKETVLQNFIINKMTQEQYDEALKSGTVKDDELYLTDLVASGGGGAQIYDASENIKGVAKIATSSEAKQGYNDNTIMTPLKTKQVIGDNIGRLNQLGYIGTLAGGVLTFEQPSDEIPYELKVGYEYLVDLLFEAVGEIDDSIKVVIKNKGNIINLVNVLHDDTVNSITVGDLKQIMKYSTDLGWRWLFKAWYTETQAGAKVLVMPSTVVSSEFSDTIKKTWGNTLNGSLQNWQSTALSLETSDGTVASILEKRSISDNSTSNIIRQYSIADMTKFAGIENSVTDEGKGRLSYEVNGENTNLTEYSADSSNTDIALKGWVLKNSNNLQITNCITEIPQDIKLELNNGDLTLKAGSKVWIPYGTSDVYNIGDVDSFGNTVVDKSFSNGKFFYAITTSVDTSTTVDGINTFIVVYNTVEKRMDYWGWDGITSFDGYNTIDGMHYNISENNIRIRVNGGIYGDNFSLPICVISKNTTAVKGFTSIDQVFNGLGYIGSTIFALPGVRMLVPRGRNEDGSLKNEERTTSKVVINTNPNDVNNAVICLHDTSINSFYLGFTKPVFGWATHQEDENKNYLSTVETDYCFVGRLQGDSNKKITEFKPKQVFKAIDRNDLDILAGNIVTTTGISKAENGFLKLGNGIIIQWGVSSMPAGGSATITFPIPFSVENAYTISTGYFSPGGTRDNPVVITARTATNFTVQNKAGSSNIYCYFHAIGY